MLEEHTGFDGALNVALVDGRGLVAFGQAILKDARRAHLARVIVRPDARSRGWGRTLVEELLARARKSGVSRVTLNVCRDNAAAASLYRSLGFSRVARPEGDERPPHGAAGRPHDDAAPCDAWLMARDLDSHTADERRAYEEGTCGHES